MKATKNETTPEPEVIVVKEWEMSTERPGYRVRILQYGNCTMHIFRPILDDAERIKRENHVKAVAESMLYNYYKRKGEM